MRNITFSSIASCKSLTTSSLTTPVQLKPFVHAVNRADARPSCLHGNENVKPRQNFNFSISSIQKYSCLPNE